MKKVQLLYYPGDDKMFGRLFSALGGDGSEEVYEFETNTGVCPGIAIGQVLEISIPDTDQVIILMVVKQKKFVVPELSGHYQVKTVAIADKEGDGVNKNDGTLFHCFVTERWNKKKIPKL